MLPNRRGSVDDGLVTKLVNLGVSNAKAEQIVNTLTPSQIDKALNSSKYLQSIIDVETIR